MPIERRRWENGVKVAQFSGSEACIGATESHAAQTGIDPQGGADWLSG